MADITRYRAEDRKRGGRLYRRVFGNDAAEASRLRWDWQYGRNPNNPGRDLEIWIAREGPAIVGQYATMPVQLSVKGKTVRGSWGMDVMVAPERQRQGLGEVLFRTWDRNVGASLGLGLSESSHRLFQKLRWPEVGPLPCLVKPLTRRALRRPNWPQPINRLVSALTLPIVKIVARTRPMSAEVRLIQRFDDSFTELWDELAPKFDLAVRRDAAYLNWKYVGAPARPLPARRAAGATIATSATRSTGTRASRAGGSRCSSTSLSDPDDEAGLETLCGGSTARRARPIPTRSAPSPCTPGSAACSGAPAISRSNRQSSSWPRSTAPTCRRTSTRTPTAGTSRSAIRIRTGDSRPVPKASH